MPISIDARCLCNFIVTGINSKDFQIRSLFNTLSYLRKGILILQIREFLRGTFNHARNHALFYLN